MDPKVKMSPEDIFGSFLFNNRTYDSTFEIGHTNKHTYGWMERPSESYASLLKNINEHLKDETKEYNISIDLSFDNLFNISMYIPKHIYLIIIGPYLDVSFGREMNYYVGL